MKRFFHSNYPSYYLWESFPIANSPNPNSTYAWSLLFTFFLCLLNQCTLFLLLFIHQFRMKSSSIPPSQQSSHRTTIASLYIFIVPLLALFQIYTTYLLMLLFMYYNIGICIIIILGTFIGYIFFIQFLFGFLYPQENYTIQYQLSKEEEKVKQWRKFYGSDNNFAHVEYAPLQLLDPSLEEEQHQEHEQELQISTHHRRKSSATLTPPLSFEDIARRK